MLPIVFLLAVVCHSAIITSANNTPDSSSENPLSNEVTRTSTFLHSTRLSFSENSKSASLLTASSVGQQPGPWLTSVFISQADTTSLYTVTYNSVAIVPTSVAGNTQVTKHSQASVNVDTSITRSNDLPIINSSTTPYVAQHPTPVTASSITETKSSDGYITTDNDLLLTFATITGSLQTHTENSSSFNFTRFTHGTSIVRKHDSINNTPSNSILTTPFISSHVSSWSFSTKETSIMPTASSSFLFTETVEQSETIDKNLSISIPQIVPSNVNEANLITSSDGDISSDFRSENPSLTNILFTQSHLAMTSSKDFLSIRSSLVLPASTSTRLTESKLNALPSTDIHPTLSRRHMDNLPSTDIHPTLSSRHMDSLTSTDIRPTLTSRHVDSLPSTDILPTLSSRHMDNLTSTDIRPAFTSRHTDSSLHSEDILPTFPSVFYASHSTDISRSRLNSVTSFGTLLESVMSTTTISDTSAISASKTQNSTSKTKTGLHSSLIISGSQLLPSTGISKTIIRSSQSFNSIEVRSSDTYPSILMPFASHMSQFTTSDIGPTVSRFLTEVFTSSQESTTVTVTLHEAGPLESSVISVEIKSTVTASASRIVVPTIYSINPQSTTTTPVNTLSRVKFMITFIGDCDKLKNNEQLQLEFWTSLLDVISTITNTDVPTDDIKLSRFDCNPLRLVLIYTNVSRDDFISNINSSIHESSFIVPIIDDTTMLTYNGTNIKSLPFTRDTVGDGGKTSAGLEQIDVIVIAVAAFLFALLLFMGGLILCRECYKRKRSASFNLLDVPHVNLKLSDFTLTRIPRPQMIYHENNTVLSGKTVTNCRLKQNNKNSSGNIEMKKSDKFEMDAEHLHVRMHEHNDGLVVGVTCSLPPSPTNDSTSASSSPKSVSTSQSKQLLLKGNDSSTSADGMINPNFLSDDLPHQRSIQVQDDENEQLL